MKKLTCRDLGGPCKAEITGESFAEVGKNSRTHVMEQIGKGDESHRAAAAKMEKASPQEQQAMMAEFERRYNDAPTV